MIQLVGLIVAVYALARLVQVPLEMPPDESTSIRIPFAVRITIVASVSIVSLGVLLMLTLALLMSGSKTPMGLQ